MNSNTSFVVVTSDGDLSITAKNARGSDTIAITVFGRHVAAKNSAIPIQHLARNSGPDTTFDTDIAEIPDQRQIPLCEQEAKKPPRSHRNICRSALLAEVQPSPRDHCQRRDSDGDRDGRAVAKTSGESYRSECGDGRHRATVCRAYRTRRDHCNQQHKRDGEGHDARPSRIDTQLLPPVAVPQGVIASATAPPPPANDDDGDQRRVHRCVPPTIAKPSRIAWLPDHLVRLTDFRSRRKRDVERKTSRHATRRPGHHHCGRVRRLGPGVRAVRRSTTERDSSAGA
jgi:hypothetical protein